MSASHYDSKYNPIQNKRPAQPAPEQTEVSFKEGEPQVAVDGFQQVLEMLRIADPAFRESLLKRLAARDRTLAANLRRDLSEL